jgi:hypothetical protein|tara:strand:+ start:3094 stop:3741 length:648 start_codon:yes stop_codon:yes gene_type:complete
MKLITEELTDVEFLTEGTEKQKKYFIEGIFMQGDVKNRNGRIYPKDILMNEVTRYNEKYVKAKRAFGELGHPEGPTVNLERVSHMITELKPEGSDVKGRAKIMDTPYGNIVKNLINEGAKLGVSSRGMGTLAAGRSGAQEVQKDFYLATAADIVADPSAPAAFVEGIMEGKEWIWSNGIIKEVTVNSYKSTIQKSTSRELEEVKLKTFEDFMSRL